MAGRDSVGPAAGGIGDDGLGGHVPLVLPASRRLG